MGTIDSLVFPYLIVALLWAVIIFFVISISVLVVGLGLHKRHIAQRDHVRHQQMSSYREAIAAISPGDAVGPLRVPDFDAACALGAAVTETCSEQNALPSAALHEAIDMSGAIPLILARLQAKDWGVRFLAASALGDFRLPKLFDPITEFARSEPHLLVFGNCLYAAANCVSEPHQIRTLFDLIHSRRDTSSGYDEGMFRHALQTLNLRHTPPEHMAAALRFCLQSPNATEPHLLSLIQAIGKEKLVAFKDELVLIGRKFKSPRLLAAVMRAVYNMGLCDRFVLEHIGSQSAILNITAIRSAAYCDDDVSSPIGQQLRSQDFNVRYAAATTLKALGATGHRELLDRCTSSDPYARDMAAFALTVE